MTAQQLHGGYQLLPNNHIFNTRIDGLSVNANNATWMGVVNNSATLKYLPAFPPNYTTNATATQTMTFKFTTGNNGTAFQLAGFPVTELEGGWLGSIAFDSCCDHHISAINTQTGQLQELYQYHTAGLDGGCPSCNADSGVIYNYYDYPLPANGATDAAGLFLQPLTLHLQELEQAIANGGTVKHALRATFASGFLASSNIWPATAFASDGGTVPFGARARLNSGYSCAVSGGGGITSSIGNILCIELQQYGIIAADGGGNWQIITSMEAYPQSYINAFTEIQNAAKSFSITNISINGSNQALITSAADVTTLMYISVSGTTQCAGAVNGGPYKIASNTGGVITVALTHASCAGGADTGTVSSGITNYMEFVDESVLQPGTAPQNCTSAALCGVTTHNREKVTFTRTSDNATATVDVALEGVAVNLPQNILNIMTGAPCQQLTALVNIGSVTWGMTPTIGTLTSGGLYCPPSPLAAAANTTVTATSTVNASVAASTTLWVWPSSIRIVQASADYTDSFGNVWKGGWGLGLSNVPYAQGCCQTDNSFVNITDKNLWQNTLYNGSLNATDFRLDFLVPQGSYLITYRSGTPFTLGQKKVDFISQGTTLQSGIDFTAIAGAQHNPFSFTTIQQVGANNKLSFYIFGDAGNLAKPDGDISSISIIPGAVARPSGSLP